MAHDERRRDDLAHCPRLLANTQAGSDVEPAEHTYREALALAEALGMRPLQAHGDASFGRLYRRIGRPDDARAEMSAAVESAAVDLYRSMGTTFTARWA